MQFIYLNVSSQLNHIVINKDKKGFSQKRNSLRFMRQVKTVKLNEFLDLSNKFIEEMEICSNNCSHFWLILQQDAPNSSNLNALGTKISKSLKVIRSLYAKAIKEDLADFNFIYKYYVFLKCVLYDTASEKVANK